MVAARVVATRFRGLWVIEIGGPVLQLTGVCVHLASLTDMSLGVQQQYTVCVADNTLGGLLKFYVLICASQGVKVHTLKRYFMDGQYLPFSIASAEYSDVRLLALGDPGDSLLSHLW
jgi:hypothetical protein